MESNRLLLLVALFFVLFWMYQEWQKDYGMPPASIEKKATPETAATQAAPGADMPAPAPAGQAPGADVPIAPSVGGAAAVAPVASSTPSKSIRVKTDTFNMRINLDGGSIDELKLLKFSDDQGGEHPHTLLDALPPKLYVIKSGLIDAQQQSLPVAGAHYVADQDQYDLGDKNALQVVLRWRGDNGMEVLKRFIFERGSYVVRVEHEIQNNSGGAWAGGTYVRIEREHEDKSGMLPVFIGPALYSVGHKFEKITFDTIKSDKKKNRSQVRQGIQQGWAAVLDHYFVTAAVPDKDQSVTYFTDTNYSEAAPNNKRYWVGLVTPQVQVAPEQKQILPVTLFMGPKQQSMMEKVAPGLALTVDYGPLTFISDPLFWLMEKIHGLVGNWGWAIVIVTLIIKLLFYPLSAASYKSMAKMRQLTPRIQSLRERYADDKPKMSQAMMDLYREEKINPLGGCLPIVIQIPVFLALYWVLLGTVELRQAGWILWIHDLSIRDPYLVLPVIMGATMYWQQKLNPPQMDPTHQKIMNMMPIVFTLFTAFFPAGLVLYWLTNNILSIGQQWMITRRYEQAAPKKK